MNLNTSVKEQHLLKITNNNVVILGVGDEYIIDANYSGQLPSQDWTDNEYKLSYFTEDVDLNEFYFHFVNNYPFWLKSGDSSVRGEIYYYVHKILLSKYKLERLSLGLGEIEDIDWDQPIVTGFYPSMTHPNGLLFPSRPANTHVPVFKYKFLEVFRGKKKFLYFIS